MKTRLLISLLFGISICLSQVVVAKTNCAKMLAAGESEQNRRLKERFGIDPGEVEVTPTLEIPVILRGSGHETHVDHFVEVAAKKVIFGASMDLAPKLIPELAVQDPQKANAIADIQMSDYVVHVVRVRGHPFRMTYDTWVYAGGKLEAPTDYILGRWQDKNMTAYEGYRDFQKNPNDDFGIISIYQPFVGSNSKRFTKEENLKMVEAAVLELQKNFGPLAAQNGQRIEIELVESFKWPNSIHVVSPGYHLKVPHLSRELGNIHFANNSNFAPELESAMARGALEALKIIKQRMPQSNSMAGSW